MVVKCKVRFIGLLKGLEFDHGMFTKCPWHIAGADESLEIGSPMIPSDKLQEVQLPLTRPALPELLYGFRGRSQPKSRELI